MTSSARSVPPAGVPADWRRRGRQVGDGERQQAAPVTAVQLGGFARSDGAQLLDGGGFPGVELVCALVAAGLLGGIEDRPVAGAAAEVAGERLVGLGRIGAGAVLLQGEQRHDETRRAEPALRAMAVDHRLLHVVQAVLVRGPRR